MPGVQDGQPGLDGHPSTRRQHGGRIGPDLEARVPRPVPPSRPRPRRPSSRQGNEATAVSSAAAVARRIASPSARGVPEQDVRPGFRERFDARDRLVERRGWIGSSVRSRTGNAGVTLARRPVPTRADLRAAPRSRGRPGLSSAVSGPGRNHVLDEHGSGPYLDRKPARCARTFIALQKPWSPSAHDPQIVAPPRSTTSGKESIISETDHAGLSVRAANARLAATQEPYTDWSVLEDPAFAVNFAVRLVPHGGHHDESGLRRSRA